MFQAFLNPRETLSIGLKANTIIYAVAIATSQIASRNESSIASVYAGVVAKFFAFSAVFLAQLTWLRWTGQTTRYLHEVNDSEKEPLLPQILQVFYIAIPEALILWYWLHCEQLVSMDTENDVSLTQHLYFIPKSFVFEITLDFFHYWVHRAAHRNKFLYRWVHSDHHSHDHPGVLSTFQMSITEYVLANMFPQLMAFLVVGAKWTRFELHLLLAYKAFIEIGGHSGIMCENSIFFVQFPFLPDLNLDLTSEDHDLHHSKRMVNFSKRFRLWDVVFGTFENKDGHKKKRFDRFVNLQLSNLGIRRDCSSSERVKHCFCVRWNCREVPWLLCRLSRSVKLVALDRTNHKIPTRGKRF